MILQNLLKIGRLKERMATPAEVQRLLAAAERNLADSRGRVEGPSRLAEGTAS